MLFQETILRELAVDCLIQWEISGFIRQMKPADIEFLLRSVKADIKKKLEDWKQSDRLCDKAERLKCDKNKQQCLAGDCPFQIIALEYLEVFTKKLRRIIRHIRREYVENKGVKTVEVCSTNGHSVFEDFFAQRTKELLVEWEKRIIHIILEEQLFGITGRNERFWFIKTRKRKKDGKIIMNVTLREAFMEEWPESIQEMLRALRTKMRIPEELAPLIRDCGAAIRLELELRKKAAQKRKRAERKHRKRSLMGNVRKPRKIVKRPVRKNKKKSN